jgi:hypothetical protein
MTEVVNIGTCNGMTEVVNRGTWNDRSCEYRHM